MATGVVVPYEASLEPNDQTGNTAYDAGFPLALPVFHNTDQAYLSPVNPDDFVHWDELDYEVDGTPGAVDRNAFVLNGIDSYDAHDFRGSVASVIDPRTAGGAYGHAGWADDYASDYALGIAAQGYPDVSREESWAAISEGF